VLERVQEGFYRDALRKGRLSGELEQLATTIGSQESEHVALLADRLGSRARSAPRLDFRDSSRTPERFRDTAIELEEATIAAYIGHTANLTRDAVAAVAPLLSVEARHVAWLSSGRCCSMSTPM
jgi:hypothetical protein